MLQARRVFLVSYFVFSEMFYLSWNTIFLKDFFDSRFSLLKHNCIAKRAIDRTCDK